MKNLINNIIPGSEVTLLSHTDMDGYMSQFLLNEYLLSNKSIIANNINMQYGETPELTKGDYLIVTDLHFKKDQYEEYCKSYDTVLWIDHHPSEDAKTFTGDNVYVNTEKSATGLVADILGVSNNVIDMVNAADIFDKTDLEYFKEGREASYFLNCLQEHVYTYDRDMIGQIYAEDLFNLERPISAYAGALTEYGRSNPLYHEIQTDMLLEKMEEKKLYAKDGLIIVPTTNVSNIADLWFSLDDANKIFIGYNKEKNTISFRSTNGEAQQLALLLGGGGHPNAAGAKLDSKILPKTVIYTILEAVRVLSNK